MNIKYKEKSAGGKRKMKQTKEFVSEEEMRECLEDDVEGKGYYGDYSYIFIPEKSKTEENISSKEKTKKNYSIGAYVNGSILYVKNGGVTFNKSEAKFFAKEDAEKKSKAMSRNGAYLWKAIKER